MTASPLYFGATGTPLFAWIHPAEGAIRDTGIVLCPPVGYEYICAHRTYRVLAETLAAAGFPVLRFDYASTGDSSGADDASHQVEGWLASVHAAVTEMRGTGVRHVAVVGLRMGATLAAWHAAECDGLDALVMWAPCPSGRVFAREMRLMGAARPDTAVTDEECIEAGGFAYSPETIRALETLDLGALTASPASHVLLIPEDEGPSLARLEERLRTLGAAVDVVETPGTRQLIRGISFDVRVPQHIVRQITAWLSAHFPDAASAGRQPASAGAAGVADGVRETPVRFGSGSLFGILSEPAGATARTTAIAILNTGVDHRVGTSRMSVMMARRWAALGYRVLRLDVGGVGDSPARAGDVEGVPYSLRATDEIREAVAYLGEGGGGVVLVGMCSGAYAAVDCLLRGVPVVGICAVNPQLYWRQGDPLTTQMVALERIQEMREVERSALRASKWIRLLAGQVDYRRVVRALIRRLQATLADRKSAQRGREAIQALRRLARGGGNSLLVFGEGDPGLTFLKTYGSRQFAARLSSPALRIVELPRADHTFTIQARRAELIELLTGHIQNAYP